MQFGILGPLEVRVDGKVVPLGGAKQRTLLAALLLEPNRVVAAERLIELLWSGEPPETAANNLQVYISQLRRVLEPERPPGTPAKLLLSQSSGYLLVVGPDQLDLHRFERLAAEGRAALAEGDAASADVALRAAWALWRGPALADCGTEAFAVGERVRLEQMRLRALEDRVQAQLDMGLHADVVGELEALAGEYPLRERLCGQLMLALYRSARQAEATEVFQRTRRQLVDELGLEPGPELQQLLDQILNQDPAMAAPVTRGSPRTERTNLPLELSSFVGRGAELDEVKQLLKSGRLVTLTGAGGIGKTRLALRVGSQLLDDYADGVWLVELAAVTDPALVPHIVLTSLGFVAQPGQGAMESLIGVLVGRETLCIIDNCEHLGEACARLADALLKRCPDLRILATSRDVLGMPGEITWRVPSLSTISEVPGVLSLKTVERLEAVHLFVERASAARAGFRLSEDNAVAVARICRRLDGIPLAIELGAARVRGMSIAAIEQHLDDSFQLLTGGSRVSLPRQRTLQATLDWSHDLLNYTEKQVFRRLSVFLGGFTLPAAKAVCSDEEVDDAGVSVVDALTSLVEKSLVILDEGSDQSGRYRLLEPVRQYGQVRLLEAAEAERARRRHAMFYFAFGEAVHPGLQGPDQPAWVARVEDELDNLRACCGWAMQHQPRAVVQLVRALERYWMLAAQVVEVRDWVTRALQAVPEQDELHVHGLYYACYSAKYQGDYDEARRLGSKCLSLATQLGSARFMGYALVALAGVEYAEGRDGWAAIAVPYCEQAEPLLRLSATPDELAHQFNNISEYLHGAGDLIGARAKLHETVALARGLDDKFLILGGVARLARVEFDAGNAASAEAHCKEVLTLAGEMHSLGWAPMSLRLLARMALVNRQPERCLRLLAAAAALQKRTGRVMDSVTEREVTQAQDAARQLIGEQAADSTWREGAHLSLADAVCYGVEEVLPVERLNA